MDNSVESAVETPSISPPACYRDGRTAQLRNVGRTDSQPLICPDCGGEMRNRRTRLE
ncbi:rubrerythrin-like domain-containing protein [Halolamina salina]|uniref:Rubrerythrin-like domain-containing protein n=1 Tax=Halolamina salina TaxID=1220023 RepID=A0ABD6B584_9EURY